MSNDQQKHNSSEELRPAETRVSPVPGKIAEEHGGSVHRLLTNPEDAEDFTGQRILVIGGPDAHGVSMAVASAKYLEEQGAQAEIYVGSPVIREGKGTTHPGAFYTKTLPTFNLEGYDRAVVADIPLDFRNLDSSEAALIAFTERLKQERSRRAQPEVGKALFFLDHHKTTTFKQNMPSHGIVTKTTQTAEECHLGSAKSQVARVGAIADRDSAVLPITDEEKLLAKGLDAAVRPDPDDSKPTIAKNAPAEQQATYQIALKAWEDRAQARLMEAARRLKAEDWEYFKQEAARIKPVEISTASGFGQVAIVDTQNLTNSFAVLKHMENAVENHGVDTTPYAMAVLREVGDEKMSREPADVVSIIRHWTREDLPSVREIIERELGADFIAKYKVYGAENAQTMRLPVNDRETARIAAKLVEMFAGKEMPDVSQVRSVVMCGDPNSGKSVFSTIFREALKTLGVKVAHLDLDKAAPTPQWFLDAEIAAKEAEYLFSQNKITQEKRDKALGKLREAAARRQAMKRPWSIDLAEEAKQELLGASGDENTDFVVGDIGGGKIKKDEGGKIVKITRLTPENARILEGADAVIIVSSNAAGIAEWQKLIEMGVDPETGVRINREKPIQVLGVYQSVLEGTKQRASEGNGAGVVTNLDRSKAERKYNPTIFTTAMLVSEAVDGRKHTQAESFRNPHQHELKAIAEECMERMRLKLPEGTIVDLGGSLRSNTALKGHNDIDLRVLLPQGADDEIGVRAASAAVAEIVPFQKVRPVDSLPNQKFAVMHQLNFHRNDIEGEVEIEASIRPAEGFVGYARFQETLPQDMLDQYVLLKQQTVADKPAYKKVKAQFYAMTRWLYAKGYWNAEGQVVGNPKDMEEARLIFWGNNLEEVMSKDEEPA